MGALGHYIEREGIPTAQISLIREQTAAIKPPRALWVPFMLGRPFGAPNDPDFQRRVLRHLLADEVAAGKVEFRTLSRQLVLFCVERRKAWRMLQSKAGIENKEYKAQRSILAEVDAGKISKDELFARGDELLRDRVKGPAASKPGENNRPHSPVAQPETVVQA